jgi:hypothetical protein
MPVVAAGLAVFMLDQPITIELIIGGVLVIGAVYIGAIRGARQANSRTKVEDLEQQESASAVKAAKLTR